MSAIGPGDWVECVQDATNLNGITFHRGGPPKAGHVYRVRDIGFYASSAFGETAGLRVFEVHSSCPGHPDMWMPVKMFRPLYRPKADLITSLMQPVDGVKPLVDA